MTSRRTSGGVGVANWCCLVALYAGLAACRTDGPGGIGPTVGDGGLPDRMVTTNFDARGFEGGVGVPVGSPGAVGGGDPDGGSTTPRPDGAADSAPMSCNVLLQNCGANTAGRRLGCYIDSAGRGICLPTGSSEERTPCVEHQQCAPGLLCVEALGPGSAACQPVCDIEDMNQRCANGGPCRPLEGIDLGYCAS